jgi:hypothetical protein
MEATQLSLDLPEPAAGAADAGAPAASSHPVGAHRSHIAPGHASTHGVVATTFTSFTTRCKPTTCP